MRPRRWTNSSATTLPRKPYYLRQVHSGLHIVGKDRSSLARIQQITISSTTSFGQHPESPTHIILVKLRSETSEGVRRIMPGDKSEATRAGADMQRVRADLMTFEGNHELSEAAKVEIVAAAHHLARAMELLSEM